MVLLFASGSLAAVYKEIRASVVRRLMVATAVVALAGTQASADHPAERGQFERSFRSDLQPLLKQYCLECHSGETIEADLDLAAFASIVEVRQQLPAWLKVREMLDSGQMPPRDSDQPTDEERDRLQTWVRQFLAAEARANAGDPGPVVLRRLNNEEYNYTIRDLTGVESLDPTREFPIDGAAGEGFINSGAGQAMSPALVQKYFDAAKAVAEHLVLLPDGITFSPSTTRRDQTDANMARIQAFYRRFTADGGGQPVNLQGIQFDTNQGGLLPLERYLLATLEDRAALIAGAKSIHDAARERNLSPKYLASLWTMLTNSGASRSFLLEDVRRRWKKSTPADVAQLTAHVSAVQNTLWKFNVIGHIGDDGLPPTWMEPVNPIVTDREFSLPLPDTEQDVTVSLAAANVGGEHEHNDVVWQNPRLTGKGADIPLSHLAGLLNRINDVHQLELARTSAYLAAAGEAAAQPEDLQSRLNDLAGRHNVDVGVLRSWLDFLAISESGTVNVAGHFEEPYTSSDYKFIAGWGTPATPLIVSNSSDNEVRVPGLARPHSIMVHPSPTLFVAIGWRSPMTGLIQVEARAADVHPECGNGQEWIVQHRTTDSISSLGEGVFATGGSAELPGKMLSVRTGELISLIIGSRDGSHACDLTEVNLVITEQDGEKRSWNLAKDVSGNIQAANPHADSHGNQRTWHFYQGRMDGVDRGEAVPHAVPRDSILAHWQNEQDSDRRLELARQVQALVTGDAPPPDDTQSPNAILYHQLTELASPVNRLEEVLAGLDSDARFGKRLDGSESMPDDLTIRAPDVVSFTIPAQLANGRTFVTRGRLAPAAPGDATVRIEAALTPLSADALPVTIPIVVNDDPMSKNRVETAFNEFRQLFAPALCYSRIVPVDEVVTITLFYRQDDVLQRFMLNGDQAAELERLWDVLLYVSQEPLQYETAFEMTQAFATQDRPDLVKKWTPLARAVTVRAEQFRKRLLDSESDHLDAVLAFADRAWRRPLLEAEQANIRGLYAQLRQSELSHDEALRLTLARVLTSPGFLYRREQPGSGTSADAVSADELANRLSYFLWSSMPDEGLRERVARDELSSEDALLQETRRMLADPRARRLAVQFACQWLHLRNFDQNDDKNETLYPQFAELRSDMYEETVLFFEDMFRNNGSILDMLGADHTFVNDALARHYGMDGVTGTDWRKVTSMRSAQRGGVLSMATLLASQSGASRTSPILRGNWISETLLGERLPRPPANVPQLPETVPDGLTARELIERHSSAPECAKCHVKIDPYGFALEQYDAIGRFRSGPVDTQTTLVDGKTIDGLDGLRDYLLEDRREDVVRQFCRKLLGFALGREIQFSDEPLLDTMVSRLKAKEYRFHTAVEAVVLSRQFRQIRGGGAAE